MIGISTLGVGGCGRGHELSAPRFVGREEEAAAMRRALSRPPAVVLVEGEAGIGKSRLVRELLARPDMQSLRVLVGACPPFREPFTLGPVVDAVRRATDTVAGLGLSPLAGALRPLLPEWDAELPPVPEPLQDPAAARHRLFRALAELLDRLDVRVLVVEDAHWADEVTLEFLLFLAERQTPGLSLVVTYRADGVPDDSLLRRLSSHLPVGTTRVRVTMPPLDGQHTARLISSMLGDEAVSEEFADFVGSHTAGIPLVIEESIRLLHDRGDLIPSEIGWTRRNAEEIVTPPSIRDGVLERVSRLEAPARQVLRAAAVLSDRVTESTVVLVSGLAVDQAGAGVAQALASGLLQEDSEGLLCYRHVLAARAVYDTIPAWERRRWHLRAGRTLEATPEPPVSLLARHFREAGATDAWCDYAEQAAEQAMASGDPKTAFTLLYDLLVRADLSAAAIARLMTKTPLYAAPTEASYEKLIVRLRGVLSDGRLTRAERAVVGWQLGRMLLHIGDLEAGVAVVESVVPDLEDRPVDAAHAMIVLGWPYGSSRTAAEHRRWLDRAAMVAADPSDPARRLALLGDLATGLLLLGEADGWEVAADLPQDATTSEEAEQVARCCGNLGEAAVLWGRYGEAERLLSVAIFRAESYQYQRLRDSFLTGRLRLDWFTGAWAGLAERAAVLAVVDDARVAACGMLVAGLVDVARGDQPSAERRLSEVLQRIVHWRDYDVLLQCCAALARLALASANVERAVELTDEPMRVIESKQIWVWASDLAPVRVQALIAAGRHDEASELVASFARGLGQLDAPAPQAALMQCQALLYDAGGDPYEAAESFGAAADAWRRLPRPYEAALARERQAGWLVAAGQTDSAAVLWEQAFKELSDLGAERDAERVGGALEAGGWRAPKAKRVGRPSYGDQLSPRELEVVQLLATGATNRGIARALGLSPKTVERHIDSAMRKQKATSRTSLAMSAVEAGIVPLQQRGREAE